MTPGEILFAEGPITLNAGRRTADVTVTNTSDHTVFISSHFPFFEVNRRLVFDRALAWGMHLDVPAGDSIRWRPGEARTVRLVVYGGQRTVRGFNRLTDGPATPERLAGGLGRVRQGGGGRVPVVTGDALEGEAAGGAGRRHRHERSDRSQRGHRPRSPTPPRRRRHQPHLSEEPEAPGIPGVASSAVAPRQRELVHSVPWTSSPMWCSRRSCAGPAPRSS